MEPTTFAALLGVILVALGAHLWLTTRQMKVVAATLDRSSPAPAPDDALWEGLRASALSIDRLERDVKDLFKAVAEGIEHVDRNEKRVRGILTGARRRFEAAGFEDPGVDAEVASLPKLDEASGGEEPMQPVPEDMELGSWGSVPGMRSE